MEIPDYIKLYCTRFDEAKENPRGVRFTVEKVYQTEMLHDAAWLEFQLIGGEMSVPEARYALVGKYPKTNNTTQANSVLRLIVPYEDSIQEVPTEQEKQQWKMFLLENTDR